MSRGTAISQILRPIEEVQTQSYIGRGLHTLGLIGWLLEQTGKANVYVSTFSTSEAFLNGFYNLKKRGLIDCSLLLADLKASKKTITLSMLMRNCFDRVMLGMNHSKVVLLWNQTHHVLVVSSQNQTYGDRAECTIVTTDIEQFNSMMVGMLNLINESKNIYDELRGTEGNRGNGPTGDEPEFDWRPFGY